MGKKYIDEEVEILSLDFPNKGIGMFNDKPVVIAYTIPGQTVIADLKKKRGRYEGYLKSISKKADYEIEPACPVFGLCGGCTYQNIPYEKELEYKKNMVLGFLDKANINGYEFCGIKPSPQISDYRNKMEFSFGDNGAEGLLNLGMRKRNSYYEVTNAENCTHVDSSIQQIVKVVLEFFRQTGSENFFHRGRQTGTLRHLLVRRGYFTKQLLIALDTTSQFSTDLTPLVDKLLSMDLGYTITGILQMENDSIADVVKADKINVLYGQDWFKEKLLGLEFKVSLFSFFQTNSMGAEVLYKTVADMAIADNCGDKIVYDLYCGTGTITQILSKYAKKAVGIEIVEEAVKAAEVNAKLNNIENCQFIAGDVLEMVDKLTDKPDIIILDPPREGINPKAIVKIADFNAPKLVYVSCKASSLAKDLLAFKENGYVTEKVTCVDMFPRTGNVETVCLLTKTALQGTN